MSMLPLIPSARRASRARISFPLILALALILALMIGYAIPARSEAVEPLTVSVSLDKTTVAVGETVTATWSVSGGRAPYSVYCDWGVVSGGAHISMKSGTLPSGDTTSSFSPDIGETCNVFAMITDADERVKYITSSTIPVTGAAAVEPLAVSVSLDKASVMVGEAVTATWSISGGRAPYSVYFDWSVVSGGASIRKTSGTLPSGVTTSSFSPDIGETCKVFAKITDADARVKYITSSSISVTEAPAVEPLAVSVSLDKTTVAIGEPVTATWSISGGRAPYSVYYDWNVVSAGSHISKRNGILPSGVTTSSFSPDMGETCDVFAKITDADARERYLTSSEIPVTEAPAVEPLAVSVSLDKASVVAGEPVTATWTITGGVEPYKELHYDWYTVSGGSALLEESGVLPANATSCSFTPATGEECRFSLRVEDADGSLDDDSAEIPVTAIEVVAPLTITLSLDKTTVAVGETVTATWTITGGVAPYKELYYSWSAISGGSYLTMESGTLPVNATSCSFTPTTGEGCRLYLYVEDADGSHKDDFVEVPVTGTVVVTPLTITASLNKTTVAVGETVTATWTITGGVGPYKNLHYNWYAVSGGALISKESGDLPISATSCSFTPTTGEGCRLYLYVEDADERHDDDFIVIPVTGTEVVTPLAISLSLNPTAAVVGQPITATWTITGGVKPYKKLHYTWYAISGGSLLSKETGDLPVGATSCSFTPTMGEGCRFSMYVNDADGRYKDNYKQITVYGLATGIALDNNASTLMIGGTMPLTATITPSSGTLKTVSWSSSDPSIAAVSGTGLVTAVGEGVATITAASVDGSGLSATCAITVNPIPAASVSISGPSGPLAVGAKYRLAASVLPNNATHKDITWTTDNPGVATVEGGLVTGVAKGSAVITATAPSGAKADWSVTVSSTASRPVAYASNPGLVVLNNFEWHVTSTVGAQYGTPPYQMEVALEKNGSVVGTTSFSTTTPSNVSMIQAPSSGDFTVRVTATDATGRTDSASSSIRVTLDEGNPIVTVLNKKDPINEVTHIAFQNSTPSVAVGQTLALSPALTPSDATRPTFEWDSSNPVAVMVSNAGVASAIAKGTSVVTAYATDGSGLSASCTMKVTVPVSSVSLNMESAWLTRIGETAALQAIVLPEDADEKSVVWATSDPAIAIVNDGVVTAKGDGTATITATSKDNTEQFAQCVVTVDTLIRVVSVAISGPEGPLEFGGQRQFAAAVLPENATNKAITWSSSDESVATVDGTGLVSAVAAGETTITAAATDGSGGSDTRTITVNPPVLVTSVSISGPEGPLEFGGQRQLTATVLPENAANKAIAWSSSDESVATVDGTGFVTAHDAGETTIMASATDEGGVSDTRTITVNPPVLVTSVSISGPSEPLEYGETRQLSATILPEDAMNKAIVWSSSNESVATVDGTGYVTAHDAGETTITASASDEGGASDTLTITVNPPIPVTSVSIIGPDGPLAVGAKYRLTASVLPENAMFKAITWSTDNSDVATVEDGLVTGVSKGSAVITATAPSGAKADWNVTVSSTASRLRAFASNPGVTVIDSKWWHVTCKAGAQYGMPPYQMVVTLEKDGSVVKTTSFSTSTSSTVYMTQAASGGDYTLHATATDAAGRTDSASASIRVTLDGGSPSVTVLSKTDPVTAVTNISFQNSTQSVAIGQTLALSPVITPSNAPRPGFEWESSNPATVMVSDSGLASAIAKGTSVVTAYATDGSGLSASCTVRVTVPVSSVSLNVGSAKLTRIGETTTLQATVLPADADDKSLAWTTDKAAVATVSGGVVTAKGNGTATITAVSKDGTWLSAQCVVTVDTSIYVASVSISGPDGSLEFGGKRQLTTTVLPQNATKKAIAWSSSDESVATVDGTGLVSAVAAGETTITAAATDGSDVRDTRTITVNPPIPVESVNISGPEGPLAVGAKYRLTASVLPENATYKNITWTTDKPGVATVQDGLVTGVAKGTAVITATTPSGAKADWNVTVSSTASRLRAFAHDPGLTVAYSRWCLYFKVGAQYGVPPYTLDVIVEKDGVQAAKTTLTASGSTNLTFSGILSTAVYTMKVTATDAAGRTDSASCSVNVYVGGGNLNVTTVGETEPVSALTGLSFQNSTASIAIGSKLTLSPVVSPSGAPRPALEWDSDNPAAVAVSDSGVASAIAEGTSVITAYATDGSGLSAKCTVKAIRPVTSVTLNQGSAKLTSVGQTVTLQATVLPADATDRGLTWTTSSAAVATVSGGVVTAKGDGTATITATAKDGTGKSASCIVTVDTSIPVASISLPASKTVRTYESIRLTPTILPENATNKAVTWSSSDASIASVAAQGDGIVTGQRDGTAIITAKTANGLKASCNVTVRATASGLNAFAYNLAAEISRSLALNCTVGAQNGTPPYKLDISLDKNGTSIYTASYTTNDSKRISIPMGAIPAANYTVAVTATDAEGRVDLSSASAYITAVIGSSTLVKNWEDPPYSYVTSLRFENPVQMLALGQTDWLNISYSPSDAPYPPLVWSSSNPAAVTVSDSAITGVSKGSSVITVRTTDGSNLSASCTVTACPNVDSVSLNQKELKLIQGDTATLTATLLPADTGFKSVTWTSTNSAVASVNSGVVTGHKDGTAIITAFSSNGKRAACNVTVSNKIESIELMPRDVPLDLPLVNGAYELNLKDTFQLIPQTVPANVGASFTYKSSNPKVLSVSNQGLVTGLKAGNCTLTITARNASTAAALKKTMNIRVIVPAASVQMDPGFTIFARTSRKLKASVTPSSATYRQLKWSSSNKSVATVDSATGNVYGVSPGTADITATAHNGEYSTRQIRVTLPVGSITLTAPDKAIYIGDTTLIKADVLPKEDVDDSLKWTSGSTKIATVSQDGLVTGKGPGTVKITAAATDGSKKSGSLVLKVVKPASFISIKEALKLFIGGKATEKLAITASPAKSGYLSVTWLSDKPSIASVDQNGVVTAHADGTAIISATTDHLKTATCTVIVLTYPSYVKLNLPATLKVGEKLPLIPPLVELNGSVKSLTWKSSKPNLATIDKNGVLTAKKPGLVEIRVTTANGLSAKAKLNITK